MVGVGLTPRSRGARAQRKRAVSRTLAQRRRARARTRRGAKAIRGRRIL